MTVFKKIKKNIKSLLRTIKRKVTRSVIRHVYDDKFISSDFGLGRGVPVDRYYIHNFFCENTHFVTNQCLEFGDTTYIDKYGIDVNKKFTFNYSDEPFTTGNKLTGDITKHAALPSDKFDCIVSVNVLNFIYDLPAALLGLKKMLKQNGKLLITLAGVSTHISRYDMNRWGDYWRLTDIAAVKLFENAGFKIEKMKVYGNPYACTAQMNGFSSEELVQSKLLPSHADYQMVLSFVLSK